MDPAETEKLKQAISTQGARVGQHEQALQGIMESLHNLTAGFTQLSGRLDQSFIQLNMLTAPAPEIPVIHPGQPREPFIPTPVRYSGLVCDRELASSSQEQMRHTCFHSPLHL
ncbi:uncharacterized protein LOC117556356 isoform X2 [Gymnodraco acuticeps]|uniref:Uncharacterized protein LOC117556356 isoform X2 n=1 Tax=Gymnodraco acuticeps TaxID=8218 RepID=A0A6P8VB78_GYMAC|nr:uncharacterized protein LOC117556356 isoform X2 [Gymnodraco acuticeps]